MAAFEMVGATGAASLACFGCGFGGFEMVTPIGAFSSACFACVCPAGAAGPAASVGVEAGGGIVIVGFFAVVVFEPEGAPADGS
ncbi:MAG: hypothetical protein JO162_00055 [Alphaproteobacteria bacterium]|nr:hypothetical protein [Alphaproteobacteria bacterium]MBV9585253.1 hypothetical protein [Alphaproteobacteria bacterium]